FTGEGKILFKPVVKATVGGEDADAFVSGQVTNASDHSALADATVTAQTADQMAAGTFENSATTDVDGNYRFCVSPDAYTVTASHDGFDPSSTQVTVSGEETVTADFELTPSAP